jgi:hypothetical protein
MCRDLHQCSYLNLDTKNKDPNIILNYILQHGRYKKLSSLDRAVSCSYFDCFLKFKSIVESLLQTVRTVVERILLGFDVFNCMLECGKDRTSINVLLKKHTKEYN